MKRLLTYFLLFISIGALFSQTTTTKVDLRSVSQNTIVRIDNSTQSIWDKADNDNAPTPNSATNGTENVSYNTSSEGILISINSGSNKIKLFALTGQLLLNGELTQGRFFIQTRKGIYFLKINNKSFKVLVR
jgi:hypothetical protein